MDARRANFASQQVRAGPAPLASFEDLPSDELESPEDFTQLPLHTSSALDDESSNQDQQFTPDSLTISSQSTPRIECDFDSHFTLTPGDYEGQSTTEMRTTSLSSLSKEATPPLTANQKKGSAQSLGNFDSDSVKEDANTRKSSWANIFRGINQNSAKPSATAATVGDSVEEKQPKKKKNRDLNRKEESKSKEKGTFLSFLKKKNKKVSSSLSPGELIAPSEISSISESIQNLPEEVVLPKVTNGTVSKGKENELPNNIELCPTVSEAQNDLGKVNTERNDKIPDERKINRKIINISEKSVEKEYNILSRQEEYKGLDKISKTENIQAIVDEVERESSESERTVEAKEETVDEEKETDFEAENLISQDMSELDEDSLIEIRPLATGAPKQTLIPSRQQRLEVTTKPIDRPRSTTPINVANLEAFIKSVSPTVGSKIEKIKLSLPGEQFVGRVKSPKKSSTRSWTDFCESGLHSPRMHKRTDSEELADPFNDGANFSSESDSNWAAFDSHFESPGSNGFVDSFALSVTNTSQDDQIPTKLSDSFEPFVADFTVLSCSCHAYGCAFCGQTEQSSDMQSEVSSGSQGDMCDDHHQSKALSDVDKRTFVSDDIKSCEAANDFDSQHRQNL